MNKGAERLPQGAYTLLSVKQTGGLTDLQNSCLLTHAALSTLPY